jgi:NhaA family Na+:H+ antiporter
MSSFTTEDARHSRLRQFIDHEATGGLLLVCAALLAVVLVNLGLSDEYNAFLQERVRIGIGALTLDKSLHHFINDGLMAVFFFLVGLEIKREVTEGNLADTSQVILPAAAALGGVVAPALFYIAVTRHVPEAQAGWAIPAATDIAFALGALSLAGTRAPLSLKIFLLALATIDDLLAIIIIALFYSGGLSYFALSGAIVCLAVLIAFNRLGVNRTGPYLLVGLVLWVFVLKSGVHATLAGVALGLLIPMRRMDRSSPVHELEEWLHPYVKFLVLPLFAFANSGLPLHGLSANGFSQEVTLGIIAGLVLGKPTGILLAVALVIVLGLAKLPAETNWRHMAGVGCLAGIGFTMSLFVGSLAFSDPLYEAQVRLGVIVASLVSTTLGLAIFFSTRSPGQAAETSRH